MHAGIALLSGEADFSSAETFLGENLAQRALPADFLQATCRSGGLVLAARRDGALAGLLVSLLGTDEADPDRVASARLKMWTHLLHVAPGFRNQGIGTDLKAAERSLAMRNGIRLITWTIDAADSRQAYLSIRKLAAFVGSLGEAEGDPGGLKVEWWLTSPRVRTRIDGKRQPPDLADYLAAGTQKINPSSLDDRDLPQPCQDPRIPEGSLALVELPPDIHLLETKDPALAAAWRQHLYHLLQDAFRRGYLATDFLYLKGERFPRSYYLLSQGQAALGE